MNKQKETAAHDFLVMIRKSWTYERMTEEEKRSCIDLFFSSISEEAISGSYWMRWRVCQAIYDAYLVGIGYNGWNWRETNINKPVPTF